MIRVCIVLLIISWGWHKGGAWGAFSMFLISGIILPFLAPGTREEEHNHHALPDDDALVPARRGKRIDPTRPTHEDYAAMITDNFRRR